MEELLMLTNNEPQQEKSKMDQLAESESQTPMPSIWYT